MAKLTAENYSQGFLIDSELIGSVTKDPINTNTYKSFVINHQSGEYLGYQVFSTLGDALDALNSVKRDWDYESTSSCGENCTNENCQGKLCSNYKSKGCHK